jgi:hypothetical protein
MSVRRQAEEAGAVRSFYTAMTVVRALCEPQRIIGWARISATVLATAAAVLLASFVAVATGLV